MEPLGRFLRVLNGVPRENIEGPLGQTQGQKPEGPQAPRVFGRGSGRGGLSIYSRGTPLSTRETSRGALFTIIPPRLFHRLSFFLDPEEIKSNKTNKRTTLKRLPMVAPLEGVRWNPFKPMVAPRVYHGVYTLQETVILTQLNLNMQARDLERIASKGN